jgi:hypothetical protein
MHENEWIIFIWGYHKTPLVQTSSLFAAKGYSKSGKELHGGDLETESERAAGGRLTSGGAALALLAPVLHEHIRVELPCASRYKNRSINLRPPSDTGTRSKSKKTKQEDAWWRFAGLLT